MARRTVKDLRAAGYRFPRLTWTLNQWPIYIATLVAALLGIAGIAQGTLHTVADIKRPYEPETPYQKVASAPKRADKWALGLVREAPPGQGKWVASPELTPTQPIEYQECSAFGLLPTSLLSTARATGDHARVTVQVYGAGQAPLAVETYRKLFSSCWQVKTMKREDPATTVYDYGRGFFFNYGDAIVFVHHDTSGNGPQLLDWYLERTVSTLRAAACEELSPTPADARRSFYYDPKSYTGLILHDTVRTQIALGAIPNPLVQQPMELPTMDEPEAPLPKSLPRLPAAKRKPQLPKSPDDEKPTFTKNIDFPGVDTLGPGCGWSFTAQRAPIVDKQEIERKKVKTYQEAQDAVDDQATKYVNDKLAYSRSIISIMSALDDWNLYVTQTRQVHERWDWFNGERDKLRTPWYNYVDKHDYWLNFEVRKDNALKRYNAKVDACNAANKAVEDWEKQWGVQYRQEVAAQEAARQRRAEWRRQKALEDALRESQRPTPTETTTASPTPSTTSTEPIAPPTPTETASPAPLAPQVLGPEPTIPPITVPQRPEGCSEVPVQPEILSQERGPEPQPPVIPAGVTIPNSWPQPLQQPSVERE